MKPLSVIFKSALAILFISIAGPAFAQHGGGGHGGGGGGFHGGGGGGSFHGGGGGMRMGGGGAPRGGGSFSRPAFGYGGARGFAPGGSRFGGGFQGRPGGNFSRPGGNFVNGNGNGRFANSPAGPAPGNAANGGWHSFGGGNQAGGRGPGGAPSQAGSPNNAGGFHVLSGNRGTGPNGAGRSFSGQGGEVWENAPAARNMVPRSQSLSTMHNSFVGSRAAGLRPNASLSASSRFAGGSGFAGNRGFAGGVRASNSTQQLRSRAGFGINRACWNCGFRGFGFGGFGTFGFGGFNNRFGFGFGGFGNRFGFGFGSPWGFGGWGFGSRWGWGGWGGWGWDPFLYDLWWGGTGPGYGYYGGYPGNYVYPDSGYYGQDYNAAPPPQEQPNNSYDNSYNKSDQGDQGTTNGNWVMPNEPSASSAQRSAALAVPVLIYLKTGKILTVRDYWMVDDELHYVAMDGMQNTVDLEQVDFPRTNTENAKSGVRFIFKSEPSAPPPTPDPAPTKELNAVPQPAATT